MAKCTLSKELTAAGITGISGILCQEKPTKDNPNPKRLLMSVRGGVQRIYLQPKPVRTTPPSEQEISRRQQFAICSKVRSQLTHNFGFLGSDHDSRKLIFAAAKKAYLSIHNNYRIPSAPEVERELWEKAGLSKQMTPLKLFAALRNYVGL